MDHPNLLFKRILVCGGRDFDKPIIIYQALDKLYKNWDQDATIIEGDARGADRIAGYWARKNKLNNRKFPADWKTYGRLAGPTRNQQMIDEGNPDLVVAFPTKQSKGTWDMVRRAKKHNIPVIIIEEEN